MAHVMILVSCREWSVTMASTSVCSKPVACRQRDISSAIQQRHTSAEFVAFLAMSAPRGRGLNYVIRDNLSAHKTKAVAEFLAAR